VAIFTHFCEMFVGMWPSVGLFRLFFTLRYSGRSTIHLGACYFQDRSKLSTLYITALSSSKWDNWREDWVIMQMDFHD
jgi:hypothetical protein